MENHGKDITLTCKTSIISIVNTSKNIYLNNFLYDDNASSLYADNGAIFSYIFRRFFGQNMDKIEHPNPFTKWKQNINEAAYKKQLNAQKVKAYENKKTILMLINMIQLQVLTKKRCGFTYRIFESCSQKY